MFPSPKVMGKDIFYFLFLYLVVSGFESECSAKNSIGLFGVAIDFTNSVGKTKRNTKAVPSYFFSGGIVHTDGFIFEAIRALCGKCRKIQNSTFLH